MIPAMAAPQKRIPELDGIRGLAILLVLLYHYVSVPIPADAAPGLLFIRQLFSNGWSGVDLFFVLSGFLITGILVDNRSAGNYYRVFYLRRINRIFPLYYFFLFLFLALQRYSPAWGLFSAGLFENPLPTGPYFIYLQNFAMAARGAFGNEFLAMTWSLAIEEQFYLFLPLLVRASPPRLLPLNVLFFLGIPLALRATLGDAGFYGFVLTPWRLDSLFLGALLALVVRSPTALDFLKARLSWVKAAFYGLLLFYLYSSLAEEPGSLDHFFTFALFYACLLFLSIADETYFLARFFRLPFLKQLGLISYGIYMFHQFANGVMHDLIFKALPRFTDAPTMLVTIAAFCVTYLLSLATYHAFEKRFVAFGHRFGYGGN
jgi:peptidoglycan/LPS O-acetylase OafA/YrhL